MAFNLSPPCVVVMFKGHPLNSALKQKVIAGVEKHFMQKVDPRLHYQSVLLVLMKMFSWFSWGCTQRFSSDLRLFKALSEILDFLLRFCICFWVMSWIDNMDYYVILQSIWNWVRQTLESVNVRYLTVAPTITLRIAQKSVQFAQVVIEYDSKF